MFDLGVVEPKQVVEHFVGVLTNDRTGPPRSRGRSGEDGSQSFGRRRTYFGVIERHPKAPMRELRVGEYIGGRQQLGAGLTFVVALIDFFLLSPQFFLVYIVQDM